MVRRNTNERTPTLLPCEATASSALSATKVLMTHQGGAGLTLGWRLYLHISYILYDHDPQLSLCFSYMSFTATPFIFLIMRCYPIDLYRGYVR